MSNQIRDEVVICFPCGERVGVVTKIEHFGEDGRSQLAEKVFYTIEGQHFKLQCGAGLLRPVLGAGGGGTEAGESSGAIGYGPPVQSLRCITIGAGGGGNHGGGSPVSFSSVFITVADGKTPTEISL